MKNLQFIMDSSVEPEKLMNYIIDFESYKNFFPDQIKEVKILNKENNEIITEDKGSQVEFDAELKLSLKAKFLLPLIKNFYKRYLTAIIFKITERDLKSQDELK